MILRENEHRPDLLATLVEVYFIYHFFLFFPSLPTYHSVGYILRRMEVLKEKWKCARSRFIYRIEIEIFLNIIICYSLDILRAFVMYKYIKLNVI